MAINLSKDFFEQAINEGLRKTVEINEKVEGVIDLIEQASNALNDACDDVKLLSKVMPSNENLVKISVYVTINEDLVSKKLMDFEFIKDSDKDDGYSIQVTSSRGKIFVSSEEEVAKVISDIFLRPTFWSSLEKARKSLG